MTRKLIHVVAAVIRDQDNNILIAKRAADQHQGGLWEFPGGKVEAGEPVSVALKRELEEELGIEVQQARPLIKIPHHYSDKSVLLDVYEVSQFSGEAWGKEGQPVKWVEQSELCTYEFPAANKPIVDACLLPEHLFFTSKITLEDVVSESALAREQGAKGIVLRAGLLSEPEYTDLAAAVDEWCKQEGLFLVIDQNIRAANLVNAQALHITVDQLQQLDSKVKYNARWVCVSCSSESEVRQAIEKQIDCIFLALSGSVDESSLSQIWNEFSDLVDPLPIPVYAQGCFAKEHYGIAFANGAQGIVSSNA